jgi:hypothetical protein
MSSSMTCVEEHMRFVFSKRTCPLSSSISKRRTVCVCIKANPSSHTSAFDRVSVLIYTTSYRSSRTNIRCWMMHDDELDHQHEHNTCTHTVFTDLSMIFFQHNVWDDIPRIARSRDRSILFAHWFHISVFSKVLICSITRVIVWERGVHPCYMGAHSHYDKSFTGWFQKSVAIPPSSSPENITIVLPRYISWSESTTSRIHESSYTFILFAFTCIMCNLL